VKRKDQKNAIYLNVEDLKFYKSQRMVPTIQVVLLKPILDDRTVPECFFFFFWRFLV
jgi:hypothetical protein